MKAYLIEVVENDEFLAKVVVLADTANQALNKYFVKHGLEAKTDNLSINTSQVDFIQ